jgi:hypothetical protein
MPGARAGRGGGDPEADQSEHEDAPHDASRYSRPAGPVLRKF